MAPSAPTILQSWVWIPRTASTLFQFILELDKSKQKEEEICTYVKNERFKTALPSDDCGLQKTHAKTARSKFLMIIDSLETILLRSLETPSPSLSSSCPSPSPSSAAATSTLTHIPIIFCSKRCVLLFSFKVVVYFKVIFSKMGQSRPLFLYFCLFYAVDRK